MRPLWKPRTIGSGESLRIYSRNEAMKLLLRKAEARAAEDKNPLAVRTVLRAAGSRGVVDR